MSKRCSALMERPRALDCYWIQNKLDAVPEGATRIRSEKHVVGKGDGGEEGDVSHV